MYNGPLYTAARSVCVCVEGGGSTSYSHLHLVTTSHHHPPFLTHPPKPLSFSFGMGLSPSRSLQELCVCTGQRERGKPPPPIPKSPPSHHPLIHRQLTPRFLRFVFPAPTVHKPSACNCIHIRLREENTTPILLDTC